ncbi:MAG TPA: helix-turn-helix domain-containing protein, partial [Magnetospirillaceae bacterium]|nr:helix-turn-helix domain-containing protein [Magnetospirillaceae bacterium]
RIQPVCFAGSPQRDFSRYRGSYRQALWLASRADPAGEGPFLILDHLEAYLLSAAPRIVLDDSLASVSALVPPDIRRFLGPTLAALDACGFSAKEAAARLGVHRNTISSRLERLASFLGCDPRADLGALTLSRIVAGYLALRGTSRGDVVQYAQE